MTVVNQKNDFAPPARNNTNVQFTPPQSSPVGALSRFHVLASGRTKFMKSTTE